MIFKQIYLSLKWEPNHCVREDLKTMTTKKYLHTPQNWSLTTRCNLASYSRYTLFWKGSAEDAVSVFNPYWNSSAV